MNTTVLVTNVQRFSLHDGPGIRTTVFLKGCSLHCPWCSNPENIFPVQEKYRVDGKDGVYGKMWMLSDIYAEILKDRSFYEHEGGVTFSGGEPLLFIKKIEPLLKKLKEDNLSVAIETSLFAPSELLIAAAQYVDLFCVDIKILNERECQTILGGNISAFTENVKLIRKMGLKTLFRVPLIDPYTVNGENIQSIAAFCQENDIRYLELIKGHNLAEKKYQSLDRMMYCVPDISEERLTEIAIFFEKQGVRTKLCRI